MSFAGELGSVLHLPTEVLANVWETLLDACPDLVPAEFYALNTCRLEKGVRSWGHDIGPTDDALSAGMGFNIDWSKDFIGRAALQAIKDRGLTGRLVSLSFDGASWPGGHNPIYRKGALAGEVTSAASSAFLGKAVSLAWIEQGDMSAEALTSDTYDVEVEDRRYPAEPSLRAFHDPKNEALRG